MKISYGITVCNEEEEIQRLLIKLDTCKREEDEICVLLDKPKASSSLLNFLQEYSSAGRINLKESTFNGNFSEWKNELNQLCKGDYIFQIDADEIPSVELLNILPSILQQDVDVILIPRVNLVPDITNDHLTKWGWRKDQDDKINWPDYQWRLYKNVSYIKWINKVHERLDGFKTYAYVPPEQDYSLIHVKSIERQERQNDYYSKL